MSESAFYDRYWADPKNAEPVHDWSTPLRVSLAAEYFRGKRVLDFGCAHGESTRLIGEYAESCVGLDLAKAAIAEARAMNPRENVRYISGTISDLEGERFDVIFLGDVLEHLYDGVSVLEQLRKDALDAQGRLVLTVPYHGYVKTLASLLTLNFERDFDPMGPHVRFFTPKSLAATLSAAGFSVELMRGFGRPIPLLYRGLLAVASSGL